MSRRASTDKDKAGAVPPPTRTKTKTNTNKTESPRARGLALAPARHEEQQEQQERQTYLSTSTSAETTHSQKSTAGGRQLRGSACQAKPPLPEPGAYFVQGSLVERAEASNTGSSGRQEFEEQHDQEDMFLDCMPSRTTRYQDFVNQ
jgi:hypothetical protein